jgi:hypothetical protein
MLNKLAFENLRQRPVRTCLSVLAIGVEVTMILTLVGISYGTLDETAGRARGVRADVVVWPPAGSIISLRSSPMSESTSASRFPARNTYEIENAAKIITAVHDIGLMSSHNLIH